MPNKFKKRYLIRFVRISAAGKSTYEQSTAQTNSFEKDNEESTTMQVPQLTTDIIALAAF